MAGGSDLLDRRERVVLAEDLAGVSEGTSGEVMLHTGMRWLRYWVRFDSGAERARFTATSWSGRPNGRISWSSGPKPRPRPKSLPNPVAN